MRKSGILMHITSLPSKHGIGTLGAAAYDFVDFLRAAGQSYWQVLPIGPTGFGDSPYQAFSAFAGNPYLIDLDMLADEGLLKKEEYEKTDFGKSCHSVDFGKMYQYRRDILNIAVSRLEEDDNYKAFVEENSDWLCDYALFTAIKRSLDGTPYFMWEKPLRMRGEKAIEDAKIKYAAEINEIYKIQYLFFKQWNMLKKYANKNGVKIIGDMPIYVSADSADVFSNPEIFALDENRRPIDVAGCPPDAFSKTGQLWGNPLYDWDRLEEDGFEWWGKRIAHCAKVFDIVRIDHFRGFESYFAIPFGSKDATKGEWRKGPGIKLFNALKKYQGELEIIAEDLGIITDEVRELLKETGLPGMKVLQFAFDPQGESDYLPHNHIKNSVVYTGTHDNDTLRGWFDTASKDELEFAKEYMGLSEREGYNWGVIRTAMASPCERCIIPMQDFIGAGSEARMNQPSLEYGNWTWRIDGTCLNSWLANLILVKTKTFRRYHPVIEPAEDEILEIIEK